MQARRHEKVLGLSLLLEGQELKNKNKIIIDFECIQLPWFSKILPPYKAFSLMIQVFAIVFIAIMWLAWPLK
jgi:hypothetical protein